MNSQEYGRIRIYSGNPNIYPAGESPSSGVAQPSRSTVGYVNTALVHEIGRQTAAHQQFVGFFLVASAVGGGQIGYLGGPLLVNSVAWSMLLQKNLSEEHSDDPGEIEGATKPSLEIRDAIRGQKNINEITPEEREAAANYYEEAAQRTSGINREAGRLYNLERARYCREGGPVPPGTLIEFKERMGLGPAHE